VAGDELLQQLSQGMLGDASRENDGILWRTFIYEGDQTSMWSKLDPAG